MISLGGSLEVKSLSLVLYPLSLLSSPSVCNVFVFYFFFKTKTKIYLLPVLDEKVRETAHAEALLVGNVCNYVKDKCHFSGSKGWNCQSSDSSSPVL